MDSGKGNWPLVFLLLLFALLALVSFFWSNEVRQHYVPPDVEIENKVPDPFIRVPASRVDG